MEYKKEDENFIRGILNNCFAYTENNTIYYIKNKNLLRLNKCNKILNNKNIKIDLNKISKNDILLTVDLIKNTFTLEDNVIYKYFYNKYLNTIDLRIYINKILFNVFNYKNFITHINLYRTPYFGFGMF